MTLKTKQIGITAIALCICAVLIVDVAKVIMLIFMITRDPHAKPEALTNALAQLARFWDLPMYIRMAPTPLL